MVAVATHGHVSWWTNRSQTKAPPAECKPSRSWCWKPNEICDFRGPNISTPELEAIFGGDYADLSGGIPTPLKNMSSSDWIIIPTIGENKIHVPNHQPVISWYYMILYDIMWGNIQFIITIDNYYCWSNHAVVMSVVGNLTTNVGKWHVEVARVYQQARQVQTKNQSKLGWTHPKNRKNMQWVKMIVPKLECFNMVQY